MAPHESRFTPEEPLSPRVAFDRALQSLQELDPNKIDISSVNGTTQIHDIFEELVENSGMIGFRADETHVQKLLSPDNTVTIYNARAEDGSRISGIKIETFDLENSTITCEKVNLINEQNGNGKHLPNNDAYFFAQKDFPRLTIFESIIKDKTVASGTPPIARFDDRPITDPDILIKYFLQGLKHAKEKFVK